MSPFVVMERIKSHNRERERKYFRTPRKKGWLVRKIYYTIGWQKEKKKIPTIQRTRIIKCHELNLWMETELKVVKERQRGAAKVD